MIDRKENLDDAEEAARLAFEGQQSGLWTAIPSIVQSVDLEKQTLSAQPAIQGEVLSENGITSYVNLPLLVDVPICFPRGGGYVLTFPIAAGDEVLIVFSSRCIDSWWQSGGVQKAAEFRMHDLSDGFAILAPTSQPKKVANVSANSVELRNEAGTNSVKISAGIVSVKAATEIKLDAPLITINGNIVQATGNFTIVTGNFGVTVGTVSFSGINFATHRHTGVTTGGGNTGNPI